MFRATEAIIAIRVQGARCLGENISAYALIGDLGTAALVSTGGNLSWLCWPDFDSEACFASILGTDENGIWSLAPNSRSSSTMRRYLPGTLDKASARR